MEDFKHDFWQTVKRFAWETEKDLVDTSEPKVVQPRVRGDSFEIDFKHERRRLFCGRMQTCM